MPVCSASDAQERPRQRATSVSEWWGFMASKQCRRDAGSPDGPRAALVASLALALVAELVALPFMLLWPARVRRTVEVHGTRRDLAARMRSLARFAQPAWLGHSFVEGLCRLSEHC